MHCQAGRDTLLTSGATCVRPLSGLVCCDGPRVGHRFGRHASAVKPSRRQFRNSRPSNPRRIQTGDAAQTVEVFLERISIATLGSIGPVSLEALE
jgi:hypothetical protein